MKQRRKHSLTPSNQKQTKLGEFSVSRDTQDLFISGSQSKANTDSGKTNCTEFARVLFKSYIQLKVKHGRVMLKELKSDCEDVQLAYGYRVMHSLYEGGAFAGVGQ